MVLVKRREKKEIKERKGDGAKEISCLEVGGREGGNYMSWLKLKEDRPRGKRRQKGRYRLRATT